MTAPIRRPIVIGSAFAALAASMVLAASPVLATTELDQDQEVVDEMFRVQPNIGSADANGGAQTLTAGVSGELFAIELFVQRDAFTTQDLIVELHSLAPDGALLATSDPVAATDIPVGPDAEWMLITFPTPPTITAGDVLAIVIPFVPSFPTSDPAWSFGKASADVYAGGVVWAGSIGTNSWDPYVNGSDLAFTTYVRTGPATCDLALAVGDGEPVDDALTATVGDEVQVLGFDFPANAGVTLEFEAMDGGILTATDTTDAFGDFAGTFGLEPGDEGAWNVRASSTDDPACLDNVELNVQAAPPAPPAETPVPSTPSTGAGELPDTALRTAAPPMDPLVLGLVLIAVCGSLVATERAARRR